MFVAEEQTLGIGVDAARLRLANLVASSALDTASRETYLEQGAALLTVGPVLGISKLVRVQMRSLVTHGDVSVVALRWEAAGPGGNLFPALDADLTLRPVSSAGAGGTAGDGAAVLRLDGTYRPPLGVLGAGLDRAVLHRVAATTVRAFVRQVADALIGTAPVVAPEVIGGLPAAPAAEWDGPV